MSRDNKKPRRRQLSVIACAMALAGYAQTAAAWDDPGRPGDPASWRTPEFKAETGLGAIHAENAYAAGYTGRGQKVGIFDQPVYAPHPLFSGKDKVINLVIEGTREYTDPYIPVKKGDHFRYDGSPSFDATGNAELHGTHVAGIAAGSRNGGPMHGVAFNSQIVSVDNGDPGPEDGIIRGNDGGVYGVGWKALTDSGVRVINNSWGIGITDKFSYRDQHPEKPAFQVGDAQNQFNEIRSLLGSAAGGAYQGAIDAARSGIIVVFGTGNGGTQNGPDAISGLAYFVPDIAPNWLTVNNLEAAANGGEYHIRAASSSCSYTASLCVGAPGTEIYSAVIKGSSLQNITTGYEPHSGASMSAPHVSGSAAILMERFPYMTGAQIASVLKTTATDLGAPGIDALYGWGMIDLRKAINGPGMFYTVEDIPAEFRIPDPQGVAYGDTQFVANIPGQGAILDEGTLHQRTCDDIHCGLEVYSNDISGHGGLTKIGAGALVLTGADTYSGPTRVNQGLLAVNGSLTSDVSVQSGGTLGGSGRVGSLTANRGATVAPGNSIGTLRVDREARFESGSDYRVEVAPGGRSDRIDAGQAVLGGGTVSVSLENGANLLSQREAESLLGEKYTILTTRDGVSGRFDGVNPSYPFISPRLNYASRDVGLEIARTGTAFDAVALTANEKSVARAVESLGATSGGATAAGEEGATAAEAEVAQPSSGATATAAEVGERVAPQTETAPRTGNPVFESVLASRSPGEARRAGVRGALPAHRGGVHLAPDRHLAGYPLRSAA